MKILWICNILFPEAEKILTGSGAMKASGGWMVGLANSLKGCDGVDLAVAALSPLVDELKCIQGEKITYFILPYGKGNTKYNKEYEILWIQVCKVYQPDVVHIHGTEYTHGLAYVKACGADNVVVSIQGLVSVISGYYYSGLSLISIFKNITLRDLIKGTIFHDKNRFLRRSRYEMELLQLVKHVIGRTSWDRAHIWSINPTIKYHFCNEILRSAFYTASSWQYGKCIPHTIFVSQASYPIKGLHMLIKAMPLILRQYPDTLIRIAGKDITLSKKGSLGRLKLSGYGKIIKSLIIKYQLKDRISFLGNLDAKEMIKEYLRANVFICPSSIENSPNSLGEAQILGTPIIASYVGGVPDMMSGYEEFLYRFDDVEMLAYKICQIFDNQGKQVDMRGNANMRHGVEQNIKTTLEIYRTLCGESQKE